MAETPTSSAPRPAMTTSPTSKGSALKKTTPAHQIYTLPIPVRTFPLPTFYPNNPVSLFHVGYAWLKQILTPPAAEPSLVAEGTWTESTASVHVTDDKSIRALWEQGFYGKGSLSRSEPNWLKGEQVRRGLQESHVSEIYTNQRREERLRAKWERARLEQELIRETREAEARSRVFAPTGPMELLALPNSAADLQAKSAVGNGQAAMPNGTDRVIPGLQRLAQPSQRRKSVRFSPTVDSTTFEATDPPSPNGGLNGTPIAPANPPLPEPVAEPLTIVDKEHLQLMPEEALWLSFGLGVLTIKDASGKQLSNKEQLTLHRQHCYFPPRTGPDDPDLQPDDPFLVHYAVYHHFRSLGWVPRGGVKFGVDWLLYQRGPVFDHAEFGLLVLPSYSDPYWKQAGKKDAERTWVWLHCVLRVLSQVFKSLVLVYVDVPPPQKFEEKLEVGFAEALRLYKVREVMIKRWSANRNR